MLSKGSMTRAGFVSVPIISKPPMTMMISVNSSSSMSQTIQRGFKECFTFAIEIIKKRDFGERHTEMNSSSSDRNCLFPFFGTANSFCGFSFWSSLSLTRTKKKEGETDFRRVDSSGGWPSRNFRKKKKKIREFFKLDTKKEMTKSTNWNQQPRMAIREGGDTHTHTHTQFSLSLHASKLIQQVFST